eukprot:13740569-Ditylum_brightwellii.AAC.1
MNSTEGNNTFSSLLEGFDELLVDTEIFLRSWHVSSCLGDAVYQGTLTVYDKNMWEPFLAPLEIQSTK